MKDHIAARDDAKSAKVKAEPTLSLNGKPHSRELLSKSEFKQFIIIPLSKEFDRLTKATKKNITWMKFYNSRIKGAVRKFYNGNKQ